MRDRSTSHSTIATALGGMLLLPLLALTDHPAAAAEAGGPDAGGLPLPAADPFRPDAGRPPEVVVHYKVPRGPDRSTEFGTADQQRLRASLNRRAGAVAVREQPQSGLAVVRLAGDADVDRAVQVYRRDPAVAFAEPNQSWSTQDIPSDPRVAEQWALHNTGQTGGRAGADIDAPRAWDRTTGSRSVVVVVIDTGIDAEHPDLAPNVWSNPGEIPGDHRDNDHNGYVDDVHGWDAVDHDGDPSDTNGHGTHVAGTIGARGDNHIGIAGVSWRVSIAGCRFLDETGSGATDGAVACLDYVKALRRAGVPVVATNNSWAGSGSSELLRRAIRRQLRVLFVAAAGNDGEDIDRRPGYPASYPLPNVLAVAATDDSDHTAAFSNVGRGTVLVGAPGVDIVSLRAAGTDMYGDGAHFVPDGDPDARYYGASGTSMATPHVTGVAALVKARHPHLAAWQIRNRILAGAEPVDVLEGSSATGARLDALGAVTCSDRTLLTPVGAPPTFPLPAGRPVTFRVLHVDCGDPAGAVRASTERGDTFLLRDDGVVPDFLAGDGVYSARFVPTTDTRRVRFGAGGLTRVLPALAVDPYTAQAQVGLPYQHRLQVVEGTAPVTWTLVDGSLPDGVDLGGRTGVLSGVPAAAGRTKALVRVRDRSGRATLVEVAVNVVDDPLGEHVITVDHSAPAEVVPLDHAVDADGNTVVVGRYTDPVTRDEDVAVTKYAPDGSVVWRRLRRSDTSWWANWGTGVALAPDGSIYVTSEYPYFHADSDVVLTKLTADGDEVWTTTYSEGWVERANAVTVDASGDVLVVGTLEKGSESSVLTLRFHPDGALAWARTFHADGDVIDLGRGVGTDPEGNVLVAGGSGFVFESSGGLDLFSYSVLLLKYDAAGELVWSSFEHDPVTRRLDVADAMVVDAAGNTFLGGTFSSDISKYDADGALAWAAPVTTLADAGTQDLALGPDGEVVVAAHVVDAERRRHVNALATLDPDGAPLDFRRVEGDHLDGSMDVSVDGSGLLRLTLASAGGTVLTSFGQPLAVRTAHLPPAVRGSDYHHRLRVAGGVRPVSWDVSDGALPSGLTLDPATGEIAGVPLDGAPATFTVTATAADGVTASRELTLDVAFVAIDEVLGLGAVPVDQPWQLTLTAQGSATPFAWDVSGGDLPPGVLLDPDTGVVSGIPTTPGSFPVTVRVTDAEGHSAEVILTVVVVAPLVVTTSSLPDAVVGQPYSVTLAHGGGVAPYAWGFGGEVPAWLAVDMDTGELSGVPTESGVFEVPVFVTDGTPSAAFLTLSLTVG
ncbi:MAG: S8 family serine peptidase [Nocardioidaceae bacterium]